ncbi:hypothetical protein [Pseudoduganella chitinolytica]|uniref:Uncharacterized protein n=1 Tax=Pseudoduganella chitinolytica TaxID=34070 RepID=A0ABY8BI27_9BURK|nr:hypothetical protein [Pseudoduganella chitinolytica]WEF34581.1 hypothetical protein PX653_07405 [Pseudoduganella chitinolytica]
MIALIGSPEIVRKPAGVTFMNETFGQGQGSGVRKETQLGHAQTKQAELRSSVAEIRSDDAIDHSLASGNTRTGAA